MGTAADLLHWAHQQVGITENPPNSNRVPYWDQVGMHPLQGNPWCAAFVLAGLVATGTKPVTRSVYVPQIETDYRRAQRFHKVAEAQPGDQICFKIADGHTGILVSNDNKNRTVTCVEGNTSPGKTGSQNNGGGVWVRTRSWSLVSGAGRPPFSPAPSIRTPGEAMARFPNAVDACWAPNGGVWVLGSDGGVGAYRGAPLPAVGPVSYPGLPADQRQGDRTFLRINPSTAPGKLYDCFADDGSVYTF